MTLASRAGVWCAVLGLVVWSGGRSGAAAASPPQVCVVQIMASGEVMSLFADDPTDPNIAVLVPPENATNVPVSCQDLTTIGLAVANQEASPVSLQITVFTHQGTPLCARSPFTLPEHGARGVVFGSDCEAAGLITPGADIVVFNDINLFDNTGMGNPNNSLVVANLVNFTNATPRGSGTVVWFDRGRNSRCGGTGECGDRALAMMQSVINAAGYSITNISSTSGSITSIPEDVKAVFLWNPLVPYTTAEINAFKQFASEGGRVIFIGEWDGYYGSGIALENQFLLDMGAVMTNIGMAVDCGYNDLPAASLRPHQITTGMTGVRIGCASVIVPGPDTYPFLYDRTNTRVLAGVAKIDTTPLPLGLEGQIVSLPQPNTGDEGINPNSSTGY